MNERRSFIGIGVGCVWIMTALLPAFASAGDARPQIMLVHGVERIEPEEAPTIDGALDEPVWERAPVLDRLRHMLGDDVGDPFPQRTEVRMLSDGANTYIGVMCYEPKMDSIRADPARSVFWNDCVEIYFNAAEQGDEQLFLVVDVLGRRHWARSFDEGFGWWDDPAWRMLADWDVAVQRDDDRWSIELRINNASFGIVPTIERRTTFNVARFRFAGGTGEFGAWGFGGRTRGPGGRFQKNITTWGHLLFVPEGMSWQADREGVVGDYFADADITLPDGPVMIPRAGGVDRLEDGRITKLRYRRLLADELERVEHRLSDARDAVAETGDAAEVDDGLLEAVSVLDEQLEAMRERIEDDLEFGEYERLVEGLDRMSEEAIELAYRARLELLLGRR